MQLSQIDLEMNSTCDSMNLTHAPHLITVATLPC